MTTYEFNTFENRQAASAAVAAKIIELLHERILKVGHGQLLVSGGSTPEELFDLLATSEFDHWASIDIGLVDERWVNTCSDASNEKLVRDRLLKGRAKEAKFHGLWRAGVASAVGAKRATEAYTPSLLAPTVSLIGMGTDGHTASWFPGAVSLADAVNSDTPPRVLAFDAKGCPVAGPHTDRLTVNLPVLARSSNVLLLIFGEEKKQVFSRARRAAPDHHPIRYVIDTLREKLTVYWAP